MRLQFLRIVAISALAALCIVQTVRFRRFAPTEVTPIDITQTIEYRMAKWFDANMHGRRVFAPGNVSLWMTMFTDTPETDGCCAQGMPSFEHSIADYAIYTGQNAGRNDTRFSILWLKAYGADAIGVSGRHSTEVFHPFWNPYKFEGVLPVVWRDGDNAVYDLERRSQSLAHVVKPGQIVSRPPENGLDVAPLIPYVQAIEATDAPRADFRWLNGHQARIEADVPPHKLISVQVSYDPGWRITVAGARRRAFADALGLMVIDPQCEGHCVIDLEWGGGAEARWMRAGQILGFLSLIALTIWARRARHTPVTLSSN